MRAAADCIFEISNTSIPLLELEYDSRYIIHRPHIKVHNAHEISPCCDRSVATHVEPGGRERAGLDRWPPLIDPQTGKGCSCNWLDL